MKSLPLSLARGVTAPWNHLNCMYDVIHVCCLVISKITNMEASPPFPDPPAITVERTLAIIKPDAIDQADNIIEDIKKNGFTILQVRISINYRCTSTA